MSHFYEPGRFIIVFTRDKGNLFSALWWIQSTNSLAISVIHFNTYSLLTYSIVQDISWKADCHSSRQKLSRFLTEPEGLSPYSQMLTTGLYPEPKESVQVRGALKHFVTIKNFYGEGLSAPHPTPQLRITSYRLSATVYSIYSQLPSVPGGLPSIRNLRTRHAVVTRDPPNVAYILTLSSIHTLI
jgi:hypothetical protein